jgi:hypothetical protein
MAKQLWTIQCPKCGRAQQVEPRPDTYRCPYCGTIDFFDSDDSTLLLQQEPPVGPLRSVLAPVSSSRVRWVLILLGLLLGSVGAYFGAR